MTYYEPKRLTGGRRWAFIAYVVLGLFLVPFTFLFSVLAGCPAFAPLDCKPASDFTRYLIFPGISFVMLLAGVLLHSWLKRNQA